MDPGFHLAILNLGGAEIILLLALLLMLGVAAVAVCALIYFIVRAALNRRPRAPSKLPAQLFAWTTSPWNNSTPFSGFSCGIDRAAHPDDPEDSGRAG